MAHRKSLNDTLHIAILEDMNGPHSIKTNRPQNSRLACAALCLWFGTQPALLLAAGPQITGEITLIENRPPDDLFGFPGLYLLLRVDVSHADGIVHLIGPPAGATAESNNNNFPFAQPVPLTTFAAFPTGTFFLTLIPITPADFPEIDGRYTYRVADNDGQTDQQLGHRLNRMEVIPLPVNLQVSDNTTTPMFTFTDPNPDPGPAGLDRRYTLLILDADLNGVAQLPSAQLETPIFQVPPNTLCPCNQYYFRAESFDFDVGDAALENLATAFLPFAPTDAPRTGDISHDCLSNGADIQPFVQALLTASTQPLELCAADFSNNGTIDTADIPGFVNILMQN